jgi:hypothetical protein
VDGVNELHAFTINDLQRRVGVLKTLRNPHRYAPDDIGQLANLHRTNPYARSDDLALILIVRNNVAVGRLHLFAARAFYGGTEHPTYWMRAFHMDDHARKVGAGASVILEAKRRCGSLVASGAPSEGAQKLYRAAGLFELPRARRFLRFYRPHPVIEWYLKRPVITAILGELCRPVLMLHNRLHRPRTLGNLTFQQVEKFDSQIDDFHPSHGNYFPRPAKLLNWLMTHKRLYGFLGRMGDEAVGYSLLRCDEQLGGDLSLPRLRVGVVLDWYLREDLAHGFRSLLLSAMNFFGDQQVDVIECQVRTESEALVCKEFGMLSKGGMRAFFRPLPGTAFDPTAEWHLTAGVADLFLEGPDRKSDASCADT